MNRENRAMERNYLLPLAAAYGSSVLKVFENSSEGSAARELDAEMRNLELRSKQSTGEDRWDAQATLQYLRRAVC